MGKLHNYDIEFLSLKPGAHSFKITVGQPFFDLLKSSQEFTAPKIEANILLNKHSSFLELEIETKGEITLNCDISEEEYNQPVENKLKVLVKFGEEFDDSNEEVLIIPLGSHSVNVAQLIYESIMLSIPMKHVHPRYLRGYEDEYTNLLNKYSLPEKEDEIDND